MATKRAMVTATRVAGDKKAMTMVVDGNEGGGRATVTWVMASTWAMAMAMRLAGNKKAREGCKRNGDGNVRVAGNEEGKGRKAIAMAMATKMAGKCCVMGTKRSMAMATRVVGKQRQWQQRG